MLVVSRKVYGKVGGEGEVGVFMGVYGVFVDSEGYCCVKAVFEFFLGFV